MIIKKQYNRGAAMILFVLFFAFASSAMMFSLGQSIFSDLSDFNRLTQSKQSFLVSESLTEDVVFRRMHGSYSIDLVESLTLAGIKSYSTTTYNSVLDSYLINTNAMMGTTLRKSTAELTIGAGSAFNYGLQAGNGGIILSNNSDIFGNVYSNGKVLGAGSAEVVGDIVSAGPTGNVETISLTGSVYANTINNINAGGNAYYNVQVGTNAQNPVGGSRYTPVTNQATTSFPISTTTIQEWKDAIINHGTVISASDPLCSTGTYTLDVTKTIGYLKVECNLDIKKTGTSVIITLTGPIWVTGNLSFTQGPIIKVSPSLGRMSVQMIADNPSDRLNSSKIEIKSSTSFVGSGDSRSYIMLMSQNESASVGGTVKAIDVTQSASGAVLIYAGLGLVQIGNNIDLREVTAYQINIDNGSSVTYESGLASLLFTSGPGGAYVLNDWQQGQ